MENADLVCRSEVHIVALTGAARSGKDTAARVLVEECGYVPMAFATPIKKGLAAILDCQVWEIERLKESPDSDVRRQLQTLGTEWGREINGPNFWVELLLTRMKRMVAEGHRRFVITDVRFVNELKLLQEYAPTTSVKIVRDSVQIAESSHASEAGIPEHLVDYVVTNDGTRECFEEKVSLLFSSY